MSAVKQQDGQNDCSARPQRTKGRGVPLGYVEGLSDARTKQAAFFSSLLDAGRDEAAYHAHFAELLIALSDELIRGQFDQSV